MKNLLAIVLATQPEHGTPALTFAYPPVPQPIPRLDRPVYKREQARAGDAVRLDGKTAKRKAQNGSSKDSSAPTSRSQSRGPRRDSDDDLTGMRFVRGLRVASGSSSEEDSPHLGGLDLEDYESSGAMPGRASNGRRAYGDPRSLSRGGSVTLDPEEDEDFAPPTSFYRKRSRSASRGPAGTDSSKYLGFSPETWGDLLTPRDGHGSKLEVVIDALAIIGHPVRVKRQEPARATDQRPPRSRGRSRTRANSSASAPDESGYGSDLSEPSAMGTAEDQPPPSETTPAAQVSQLTKMLAPPPSTQGSTPSPTETVSASPEDEVLSTSPAARLPFGYSPFASKLPETSQKAAADLPDTKKSETTPSPTRSEGLSSFTLALIVDTPPASHLSEHLDVYYRDVVLKLTAALKRLERARGYVSREAWICRGVDAPQARPGGDEGSDTWVDSLARREAASGLASELASIFDNIRDHGAANATFDSTLDLEVLLHKEYFEGQVQGDTTRDGVGRTAPAALYDGVDNDGKYAHVSAWRTLLPLVDDTELLATQVPPDSLLYRFIDILTPSTTLDEFQALLDTDAASLAEVVDHLLYWRKAKLVDVVSAKNVYRLAADSEAAITGRFAEFARDFAGYPPLPSIISRLSQQQRPFSTVLPSLDSSLDKSHSHAVLVWLLRNDLIARVRTHVRVIVRVEVKERAQVRNRQRGRTGSERTSEGDAESMHALSSPASPGALLKPVPSDEPHASSVDSSVEIRFSPAAGASAQVGYDSVPDRMDPGTSGFSLHPHRYPSGSSGSQPTSFNNFGATSSDSSSSHSLGVGLQGHALSGARRRQRWRQESAQSLQSEGSGSGYTGEDGAWVEEPSIVPDPGRASGIERLWLEELSRDKSESLRLAFNAALRYFDGDHPLEEIISRSGVGRRTMKELLSAYEQDIVLLMHP